MALVRQVEWEECLLEPGRDRELERRVRRDVGQASPTGPYFHDCPWMVEALARVNKGFSTRVFIEHELADLVGLVVSQDNSCRFCFAAQRALLRVLGFPQARISKLEQDSRTADLSPRERAALEFARRVSRSNPLPGPAELRALREAGFEELAIAELASLAALMVFLNRVATLPALPPGQLEQLPDRWYVRLFRPLIAPLIRRRFRSGELVKLTAEQRGGPFAPQVCALDGLPAAGELRHMLDAMWDSPLLTRRAKALVFAVVARSLGCSLSEGEARRLLAGEGVAEAEVEEVLSHLSSPGLDPVEKLIVPFARETVWPQVGALQRRARQVRGELSAGQFAELVGVVALANTMCRLGVLVDGP